MASTYVDGVRMDWIRRCEECGQRPRVSTSYKGMTPGDGPFVISCRHGNTREDIDRWVENGGPPSETPFNMYRSWSKTRCVKGWNAMQRRIIERKKHEKAKAMVWVL